MRMRQIVAMLWSSALLGGCAAGTQTGMAAHDAEPDCSFRSPTTCWTVSGRFPTTREPASPLEPDPRRAPAVLAGGPDTARTAHAGSVAPR
jgi:hypothetical protein